MMVFATAHAHLVHMLTLQQKDVKLVNLHVLNVLGLPPIVNVVSSIIMLIRDPANSSAQRELINLGSFAKLVNFPA